MVELLENSVEDLDTRKSLAQLKSEIERQEKLPELESENHRIDMGLSTKEKLRNGWKQEKIPAYVGSTEATMKVLKKELAPGAFVREYSDDEKLPKHLVGEQFFNREAVKNLGLEKRLPNYAQMLSIKGDNQQNFFEKNFKKDGNNVFPGVWNAEQKRFNSIGMRADLRLSDGSMAEVTETRMDTYPSDPAFAFSLRLLK